MPAWIYVLAVAAVLTVAWYGFARRWWHALRYSMRRAAHAYQEVERDYGSAPTFYGSMLPTGDPAEDEFTAKMLRYGDISPGRDGRSWGEVTGDWREQTRVELAPETLDLLAAPTDDPGPGGDARLSTSPPPGPDHSWRDEARSGMIVVVRDGQPRYEYPQEPGHIHNGSCAPGRCWDGGPGREQSPDWLEAQRAEVYAWARGMVPQVTGWSVRDGV